MTRKNIVLVVVAGVLAVVYAVYFTNWFTPKTFKIFHTVRNFRTMRPGTVRNGYLPSLQFGMSRRLELTEIKVVRLSEWETNKHALPIWHMVTESNSVSLNNFAYGQFILGLHPAIKGTHPDLPDTNVVYRMFLAAGKFSAAHDFELK